MFGLFYFILHPIKCQTYCRFTGTVPTHTSIQVVVHYGLPDFTWAYTHGKEVVTLVHFLNTNGSCVHTHIHTNTHTKGYTQTIHAPHTYIHPAKRKWCFLIWSNTRNLSLSYGLSNRKHNTHAHTGSNIHIFTRQSVFFFFFFFPDAHIHCFSFFTLARINAHRRTHTDKHTPSHKDPSPWHWRSVCLIFEKTR